MTELAILIALSCFLIVGLSPAVRVRRRARAGGVGATAERSVLGPQTLRRENLVPILGGPARMPRLLPAMGYAGLAGAFNVQSGADAGQVSAGSERRRANRPFSAPAQETETAVALVPASAANAGGRRSTRRSQAG